MSVFQCALLDDPTVDQVNKYLCAAYFPTCTAYGRQVVRVCDYFCTCESLFGVHWPAISWGVGS